MPGVPLSDATRRRIELLFQGEELRAATDLLVNQCVSNLPFSANNGPTECERVRFAALKVSGGRLDFLREAVRAAQTDWRDLLMAAGFGYDCSAHEHWMPTDDQ